jgi:hypothetical protein
VDNDHGKPYFITIPGRIAGKSPVPAGQIPAGMDHSIDEREPEACRLVYRFSGKDTSNRKFNPWILHEGRMNDII